MARKDLVKAVGYLRTSSAANVGADKDSEKRQRQTIRAYAKVAGYDLVEEFNDPGVSGADPIESRPGFSALLDHIEGSGVRIVVVEDGSRLARTMLIQELAILSLKARGVRVIASNGEDLTETEDEMKVAMRQIAGAFAQLEKARLVKKLKAARDRKRATGAKVEGRKSHAEMNPEMVAMARKLHRYPTNGKRRSLRDVAAGLAAAGFLNSNDKVFTAQSIKNMLEG